jgi:probable phosphoglycerate mutase
MVKNTESIRILLVRHGETDWNRIHRFQGRSDLPLNQKGREQAHALALGLKDQSLAAIYSSPLARTIETARLIKAFHPSVPLYEEEGLVEMNLGEFEGMEAGHWVVEHADFVKTWREKPASVRMPGGESLLEVQTRAIRTLQDIAKRYPMESTLLLCSHNFVNLTLLCYALKIPLDRFRDVRQEPAALNVLFMEGERLVAEVVNDRSLLRDYDKGE